MIEVRAGGKRLVVQGHAGYGPAGQDIVCAAASALVYALAETLAETGRLAGLDIRKGYAEVTGRGDCAGGLRAGMPGAGHADGAVSTVRENGVVTYHGKELA